MGSKRSKGWGGCCFPGMSSKLPSINDIGLRHMRIHWAAALTALALAGCATGTVVVQRADKISAPKVVALDAPMAPWVPQIETRLRQRGFQVKRFSRDQTGALTEMGARYVLRVSGAHFGGWGRRCIGGGYEFQELTAELIDIRTNEALASVSGEGYSEDCPPLSGTIFGDIAGMVSDRWE